MRKNSKASGFNAFALVYWRMKGVRAGAVAAVRSGGPATGDGLSSCTGNASIPRTACWRKCYGNSLNCCWYVTGHSPVSHDVADSLEGLSCARELDLAAHCRTVAIALAPSCARIGAVLLHHLVIRSQ